MDSHRGWRRRANELSETTKLFTLFGTYIREYYGSRYYGKATNLARQLTAAYDAVLASHDLLLLPTTPMKAQPCLRRRHHAKKSWSGRWRWSPTPPLSTSRTIRRWRSRAG